MSPVPGFLRSLFQRWPVLAAWLLALLLVGVPAFAQQTAAAPTQNKVQADSAAREREKERQDSHLSRQDAEELFRSADSLLKFASDDSGLPIRRPVQRALASRDQVESHVEQEMHKDQESGRFKRAQSVLQKFGLIPRDLDLEALMLELLREQIVGYYDSEQRTFYMLDWVAPGSQRPVIAHELTHALQDQAIGLDQWLKDPREGDKPDGDVDLAADERVMARSAVTEGQATVVMLDYLLQPGGRTVVTAQDFVNTFQQGMLKTSNFPVLDNSPRYVREMLIFPYRYGLGFVRAVLIEKGKDAAFLGLLQHPPSTTREIMEPRVYLGGERLEPLRLPPLAKILGDRYPRYDVGAMGEFDVRVLLEQFAGEKAADKISPRWRGGYYYTAVRPEALAANSADAAQLRKQALPPGSLALLYVSRWDSSESAERFARAYAGMLSQRYPGAQRAPKNSNPQSFAERVANHTLWQTSEGAVFVESWGETVLVMEGFDAATAARLRDAVLERSGESPAPAAGARP